MNFVTTRSPSAPPQHRKLLKMKILTVLGARPQFIKASVVSHAIGQTTGMREVLAHTGQHFDANMSDVFFAELGMAKPDYFA